MSDIEVINLFLGKEELNKHEQEIKKNIIALKAKLGELDKSLGVSRQELLGKEQEFFRTRSQLEILLSLVLDIEKAK